MSKRSTQTVSRLLTIARENETIPWSWIVDDTRREELVSTWDGLGEFGETVVAAYRKDFWQQQESWIKVVSEKATIGGILRPVLREFAVGFQVFHGFGSATAVHNIAQESLIGDRTLEPLYVGDFDPSGLYMSEVDLPERIKRYGGIILPVNRLALTEEDCTDALPSFDVETKSEDPRYKWWCENYYGDRCWEIDAMDPRALRERVRDAIVERIDSEAWDRCKLVEDAERESLNRHIAAWPSIGEQI